MQYDLNDLYYYVKVVEHGGFSQAGLALGIPKSKLSRRVADLEQKLKVSLIYRSTRQFHVTDIGQVFYQQCKNVIDEAEIAHELICSVQSHPKGTIKLSCPVALLQVYLNDLLIDFMVQYPDIDIQILAVNRPVDVISEGLDLALRVRSLPLDDSGLMMKVLGYSRRILVASPLLFKDKGVIEEPEMLVDYPMLANTEHSQSYSLTLKNSEELSFTQHFTPKLATTDVMTLYRAALKGIGIARLPYGVVENELNTGELVEVLPEWRFAEDIIHAVYPSRKGLLPAVQLLLNYLADNISPAVK
ncbi:MULTISPECIES: LysR substrate-binding domain-containing protein [Providencia]|uniref:LysR family transcriptional regulator n=1 Tax=Providencia heimbachae ATCC 35613 TaxID=1354272 RepID=A0A1B7JTS8_9GAMM|nr:MULTISPECIES: LysR substrate-binding domain-containing protein [Providencia]MBP6123767.1 LysR family transcriptional regulator [Providencia sp.]MDD9338780.1 LysR substrate-binding domain-containing protein [Providencia heimbachae]NIH20817.1 LysR family transcriptional regulator [Providencia heimbachae]OAT51272.1 LysR family transcriptional regulator [Providencia heimbachae ATCC 35613]QCJ68472.1 LysR family transcriptional regulator [Providencia heimbachae]